MTYVLRQNNESVEKMLGRFRRKVMGDGVLARVRSRKFHSSKLNKRQLKIRAQYRTQKQAEEATE
ncbi:30S ribosomal protein S21 [Candidatus Gracilibacteria bacterium]|nr:30S ribosomal protein S21 [Candidatus Gracilibacteria bacterium]